MEVDETPTPELKTHSGEVPSVFQPIEDVKPTTSSPPPGAAGPAPVVDTPPASPRHTVHHPPALLRAIAPKKPKAKVTNNGGQVGSNVEMSALAQRPNPEEGDGKNSEAGPSTAPVKKVQVRKPQNKGIKKPDKMFVHTNVYAPPLVNVKNPAGDFLGRESNVDVIRQISQAKAKREKEEADTQRARLIEEGEAGSLEPEKPLDNILIIHPGSRNLRIGRASSFYPKEVPFCIARPEKSVNRGADPPIPGSRAKRQAEKAIGRRERKRAKLAENGKTDGTEDEDDEEWADPVDKHIEDLRDYLRNRLRQNRLSTDYRDGFRVKQYNAKVKPESIPEHNDPFRIDWTEVNGKKFFVGTEALRLPSTSGFKVRYPLLHRGLNTRDWGSPQLLMDDIATILHETLRTELDILPKDYSKFSVVLLVPDHNDRLHLQALVSLLFGEFGFKEMAIHQEAHAAVFSAGMSTACVVDIGATSTSVVCVDEGMPTSESRIKLDYGGDDITAALVALLTRSNFPYKELDLGRAMEWAMMDKLKEKICTLEEHMVANISWDIHVLKEKGLTQKYQLRTYDENILAPLCFFDTRMIDFTEKEGNGRIAMWDESEDIDDQLYSSYGEPTSAMRSCVTHLLPAAPVPEVATNEIIEVDSTDPNPSSVEPNSNSVEQPNPIRPNLNGSQASATDQRPSDTPAGSTSGTPAPPDQIFTPAIISAPAVPTQADIPASAYDGIDIVGEAAHSPLDAAIAASISMAGNENKVKAAAASILLIGGGSALKGLYPFIEDRLPALLRAKGIPIADVAIIPPPRGLNPRFVSWKGASVMCNLESLNDMWIRREEWEALGAKALKDRLVFL